MANTDSTPTTPGSNVQDPHQRTDGGMPIRPKTDLKAGADPKNPLPLDTK